MSTARQRRRRRYDAYQFVLQMLIIVLVILVLLAAFLIFSSHGEPGQPIQTDQSTKPSFTTTTDLPYSGAIPETDPPPSTVIPRETIEPPDITPLNPLEKNGLYDGFELPVDGATGYVSISTNLLDQPSENGMILVTLDVGSSFVIVNETSDHKWVRIRIGSLMGYIPEARCWVNLPDVIPSIVYDDTNSYASLFRASGYEIPDVTGKQLYRAKAYNPRLGEDQFIMPIVISAARKICQAQQAALALGRTLVIYEAFRPYDTQMKVANAVKRLSLTNTEVSAGINDKEHGWNISWFIATSLANHQMGYAFDTSLGEVKETKTVKIGKYTVNRVISYRKCVMPTEMHELSTAAITFVHSYSSTKKTGWDKIELAPTMTHDAIILQYLCTSVGLTPLASEWWHFNDLDTYDAVKNFEHTGAFFTDRCLSVLPD